MENTNQVQQVQENVENSDNKEKVKMARELSKQEINEVMSNDNKETVLNNKEQKALLNNPWKNHKNSYLLKNIKTNRVIKINAPSPFYAAKVLGWRPRQTVIIEEANKKEEK